MSHAILTCEWLWDNDKLMDNSWIGDWYMHELFDDDDLLMNIHIWSDDDVELWGWKYMYKVTMLMTCDVAYEYMRCWVTCSCIQGQVQVLISVDEYWWVLMRSIGKRTPTFKWYHMHLESCLEHCMHMSLCEMLHTWLCEITWTMRIMWMFVDMYTWLCLSFGDTCTLMMLVMKWKWWEHILVISLNDEV